MSALYANPIPFKFFSDLIEQISRCTAKPTSKRVSSSKEPDDRPPKQIRLVQSWIDKVKGTHAPGLDDPLPVGTIVIFFRLLFPEEGVRRRYGLQEYTFARELEKLYRVGEGTFANWAAPSEGSRSEVTGCLGDTVKRWMERKGKRRAGDGSLTLGRVDQLLDDLASTSAYSANEVRGLRTLPSYRQRPVSAILQDLLHALDPAQTSLVIQLILRDISPILYPAPSNSVSVSLMEYNSACYDRVELSRVMNAWDPRMTRCYRSVADLDWVATQVEDWIRLGVHRYEPVSPVVGLPIKVPKSERPGTCARATKHLSGKVAVETKYDGERLQAHIDLSLSPDKQIKIFSKSGRDSTDTRHLLHPIIRASLGLDIGDRFASNQHLLLASRVHSIRHASPSCSPPPSKLILEGEMVPYNEETNSIDEFWKLSFVKSDSTGETSRTGARKEDTPETGDTGEPPTPRVDGERVMTSKLHLQIVWFDVLVVGEENLCELPYSVRMDRLVQLVRPIPGFSMFPEKIVIDFDHPPSALKTLRHHFAKVITKRCEGLMLKPVSSRYNDYRRGQKWVKLKKDFIPGAGDTLDFCVVGASWQKQRARELLVPPSVCTTFFVGLEANELGASLNRTKKKHYHIVFSASYGLDRKQLDTLCHSIRQDKPQPFNLSKLGSGTFRQVQGAKGRYKVYESACTTFTFSLADHLYSCSTRPSIIFREPRDMELNGAGFQQTPGCPYYELRWPRITKSSRVDAEPLSLSALQRTARETMQIAPDPTESQVIADLFTWSKTKASPARKKETKEEKYDREWRDWVGRLERADGIFGDTRRLPEDEDDPWEILESTRVLERARSPTPPQLELSPVVVNSPRPSLCANRTPGTPPQRSLTLDEAALIPSAKRALVLSPARRILGAIPTSASSPNLRLPTSGKRRLPPDSIRSADTTPATTPSSSSTTELKRRRISCPHLLSRRTSSTPLLSATVTQMLESSTTASPTSVDSPFSNHSWSLFPPLPANTSPLVTPVHPFLDSTNHLSIPMNVLFAAGIAHPTTRTPLKLRQGWIFVSQGYEEEALEWIRTQSRTNPDFKGERRKETVWVLRGEALETSGLGDLGFARGDDILTII